MKNRNFKKTSIGLLLPIAMSLGVLFGISNKTAFEGSAYTKDGTLPTTIDLRDNTAQEIKDYYSSLSNLTSTQLQGNNLLKNLKNILKNGQKYYAYDSSGNDIWKMYEIIDRDWVKSPASAITGYSSTTNNITGYKYGTSTSNKGTNPYVHALYVDRNIDNQTRAWDDHQQTQWGINREHIWPKSQGFEASGAGGARGDPMHLWAGNGRVNGTEHNNNMYGFVDKSKTYTNPYEAKGFKNLKDNYSGKSLTVPSSTDTVFEPQDCDKGDIARSIFYMVARYNNLAGNDTIDTNNPNLALKQTTEALASYTTTSSNKQTGYMGLMTDLLYWNHLDPVDEFEIHRNNLLFNNYTYNRNPFIDYPEWADYIWGKPVYNGRSYVSYSSTPTGSVNLTTDVINGFKGEQPQEVTVSSIEIITKPTKLVYTAGETLNTNGMVVKAYMSNNTTRTLSSSDYTVSPSGALKTSDTQATVTYEGKSASFAIGVKGSGGGTQSQTDSIVMADYGAVSFQTTNQSFNAVAQISSGTAPAYNGNGKDLRIYAKGTFTFTCNVGNMSKIIFNISAQGLKRQATITPSIGTISYDMANSIVTWTGDASEIVFTVGEKADYGSESSNAGQFDFLSLDVTYGGSEASPVDVTSITLNQTSKTLEIGQSFNLSATISPDDATIKLVSWSSSNTNVAEVSDEGEITAKSAGNTLITCSALDSSGVTATCNVTVSAPVTLESLTLSGEYPTEFYVGDPFSYDGLIVTANYSNNTHVEVTDDIEISGYNMESESVQTITVAYGEKTVTYSIEVKEKGLADNEILFIASQQGLVNGDDLGTYTDSIATLSFIKNSGTQPKYYSSTSTFRVYAKNSFTISGTKKITKVEFEMASNDQVGSNTISANVGTLSGNIWTGESNNIAFTVAGTSGQRNIVSIKVTYDENSQETPAISSISLGGSYQTEFYLDDEFSSEGLIVAAHYLDGSSEEVTPTSISTPSMSTTGKKTVEVTYNGVSTTYQITVSQVEGTPKTKEYEWNLTSSSDDWIATGNETYFSQPYGYKKLNGTLVTAQNISDFSVAHKTSIEVGFKCLQNGGTTSKITIYLYDREGNELASEEVTPTNASSASSTTYCYATFTTNISNAAKFGMKVTTYGKNILINGASYQVSYIDTRSLSSISVTGDYKTSFTIGETFSFGGTVTATYSDENTEDVTSEATFSGYDLSTAGNQTVTVTFETKTTTYQISVESYNPVGDIELNFDLTKNPNNWPTTNSTTLSDYTYPLNGRDYTFGLMNVKCNSGYLMLTKTAVLGLPAIEGYKLAKVIANNSSECSVNTNVGISSTSNVANYISGGEVQTWATKNLSYTYNLSNAKENTSYYLYITNANAQIVSLQLTYEKMPNVGNNYYSLVTDISDLRTGDKIMFVVEDNDKFYSLCEEHKFSGINGFTHEEISKIGEEVESKSQVFEVSKLNGMFAFQNEDGYLSSTNGTNDGLYVLESIAETCYWNISLNSSTNLAKIKNYNETRWFKFNASSPRFTSYASDGYLDVFIYKQTTQVVADEWSKRFLTSTNSCTMTDWVDFAEEFTDLPDCVKTLLANEIGDANTNSSYRAQAMARYDYMVSDGRFDVSNFIPDRGVTSGHSITPIISLNKLDASTIIIVALSAAGVAALGGYFVFKRRKEQY